MPFFLILRPEQWIKNILLLAPLIFAGRLFDPASVSRSLLGILSFCAVSSSAYILNDIRDASRDKNHPTKRLRPIASGRISVGGAAVVLFVSTGLGLGLAGVVGIGFVWVVAAYLGLQVFYNVAAKEVVILDVMVLAGGYLLRVVAGGVAIDVEISWWLLLCTFLLALFLSFSKRRAEVVLLQEEALAHRTTLEEYSAYFLDQMIAVVTASTVVAYAFYTMDPDVQRKLGTKFLPVTIPFVLYGIFRYLYLVHRRQEGGDPSRLIITDRPFLINLLFWAAAVVVVLYGPK